MGFFFSAIFKNLDHFWKSKYQTNKNTTSYPRLYFFRRVKFMLKILIITLLKYRFQNLFRSFCNFLHNLKFCNHCWPSKNEKKNSHLITVHLAAIKFTKLKIYFNFFAYKVKEGLQLSLLNLDKKSVKSDRLLPFMAHSLVQINCCAEKKRKKIP